MRFIGFHHGHDESIAIFDQTGNLEFYAQAERYSPRRKNAFLDIEPIFGAFPDLKFEEKDVIVTTTSNVPSLETSEYDPDLVRRFAPFNFDSDLKFKPNFVIDHHFAHALASWCFRQDDKSRMFLSYDGAGNCPNFQSPLKPFMIGNISSDGFEKIQNATPVWSTCSLYNILGENSAGKAMGLAGYFPEEPIMECNPKNVMKLLTSGIDWHKNARPIYPKINNFDLKNLKFVAGYYKFIIEQIWICVEENIEKFCNGRGVVVGGGTALALELNTRIFNLTNDLVFGPPVNDSGLALGAAAFGYFHVFRKWPKKLETPSLNALQKPLPEFGPQNPKDIALILNNNEIVGLLRGKSEAGPRALGFRSIFASATKAENLKIVSEQVKGREFYRPLAPIVTSEAFDRYFIGPKGEYMQYRCLCTEEAQKHLPAIVHRDLSARPQVVYKEKDPWLHELLVEYGKLSGHECFINTSLNKAGNPICNTYEDAVDDIQNKNVTLISVPCEAQTRRLRKNLIL